MINQIHRENLKLYYIHIHSSNSFITLLKFILRPAYVTTRQLKWSVLYWFISETTQLNLTNSSLKNKSGSTWMAEVKGTTLFSSDYRIIGLWTLITKVVDNKIQWNRCDTCKDTSTHNFDTQINTRKINGELSKCTYLEEGWMI